MFESARQKIRITKNREPSNPEKRAAAKQRSDDLRIEIADLREKLKNMLGWEKRLTAAGRFVLDVGDDPTAMGQLKAAVEAAEHFNEMFDRKHEAAAEQCVAARASSYYQYHALEYHNGGPLPYDLQIAYGDSRKEVEGKIKTISDLKLV